MSEIFVVFFGFGLLLVCALAEIVGYASVGLGLGLSGRDARASSWIGVAFLVFIVNVFAVPATFIIGNANVPFAAMQAKGSLLQFSIWAFAIAMFFGNLTFYFAFKFVGKCIHDLRNSGVSLPGKKAKHA
jgi:hypothetical protein